jgi:thiol-disulfide isomerase/thioredoxin
MRHHNRIMIFYLLILAISTIFITSCVEERKQSESAKTENPGSEVSAAPQDLLEAPLFQGRNLMDGRNISLADMRGHITIVKFWATTCGYCRMEIPGLVELYSKYKDREIEVIGISTDIFGEKVVKKFIEENKINYPVIMITQEIQSDYQVRGIPATLILNKEGRILVGHVGFIPTDTLERVIQKVLEEDRPASG